MDFCANLVKAKPARCPKKNHFAWSVITRFWFAFLFQLFIFLATCEVFKAKKCLQRTLFSLSIFLLFYFLSMHSAKSSSNLKRNSVSFFSQNKRKKSYRRSWSWFFRIFFLQLRKLVDFTTLLVGTPETCETSMFQVQGSGSHTRCEILSTGRTPSVWILRQLIEWNS